jgi:hypothetical protein
VQRNKGSAIERLKATKKKLKHINMGFSFKDLDAIGTVLKVV